MICTCKLHVYHVHYMYILHVCDCEVHARDKLASTIYTMYQYTSTGHLVHLLHLMCMYVILEYVHVHGSIMKPFILVLELHIRIILHTHTLKNIKV